MNKKLTLVMAAFCLSQIAFAQVASDPEKEKGSQTTDETAFTFTESQLGEDDDMSQNVTILGSNSNLYASEVGYRFSPMRFRYRAFNQKYNDVYANGLLLNDMENGQFRFSQVGGLNNQTRSVEQALPFEDNRFSLSAMGGSNNYNFRAGSMATGSKASFLTTNRNYTFRGMYTYNSGFNDKGWAFSASLTYRWANENTAYVDGTFYNALSYFLGVEKIINNAHSLSFSTWGNPTERASQGGATDESYWLANSNFYNPNWGYQNGKVRNSRIVTDYAPTALFTWDWTISDKTKLTTTLGGRYSMYKSTKLNYNNSDNPSPDYWKKLPSAYYDVWNPENPRNNEYTPQAWHEAYDFFTSSEANRQINWDRLYAANAGINEVWDNSSAAGRFLGSAMYYVQAKNNDALTLQLNSVLNHELTPKQRISVGIGLGANSSRKYQTMEDLLGAEHFYNINTYAVSDYGYSSDKVQYDLNNPSAEVHEGDVFGYDYRINLRRANIWAAYNTTFGRARLSAGGKASYIAMQRDGKMRNGLAAENSFGKSGTASFGDGGGKVSLTYDFGHGHVVSLGGGYELRAPQASTAFAAPEVNNDFVTDLHNEKVLSSEFSYQAKTPLIDFNLSAYYTRINDATEWQNYYFDDVNSFTYVSLTNVKKEYYGVEAAMKVKINSALDFRAFGTISEAKYVNDCDARYMLSTSGVYNTTKVYNNGMRENGTPLTATSMGLAYHSGGWFIDLFANWYDRIYLSWSPSLRYESSLKTQGLINTGVDENGDLVTVVDSPDQLKGHGGWMLDASIGKSIYLKKGSLSINLSVTNLLNNVKMCTGGYEQSRSSYTTNADGSMSGARMYNFYRNPKKFYAYGATGMLNITYKF